MKTLAFASLVGVLCAALATPACAGAASADAASVADPLRRDALAVRKVERAVLLGAALAGQRVVAVGERGIVALSDDHGKTWRQAKKVPTSVTLTTVQFVSATTGWAAGHAGVVLHSSDGGEQWSVKLDGVRAAQVLLTRAQAQQQGAASERALKEAQRLVADGADKPFFDLHASDERGLVVVGASGLILATDDGGASWQSWVERVDNPRGLNLYAISRRGARVVVAGEQGLVLVSGDGGASFTRLQGPYAGSWFAAAFQGVDAIVLAGLRGNAFRVSGDAKSWTALEAIAPLSLTSAVAVTPDCTVLANQGGQLFAVETPHTRARRLDSPPMAPVTSLLRLANGAWLALTLNGIVQLGELKHACSPASPNHSGTP